MRFIATVFLVMITGASATAEIQGRELHHCQITPSLAVDKYPGEGNIRRSSSLAQPPGKSEVSPGQPLVVYGRVYDSNCVPVVGAEVDIWHADTSGNIVIPPSGKFADPYPLFAGSGRASTDNEGRFNFFTIFPGSKVIKRGKQEIETAPHINFRIKYDTLPRPLMTTLFFDNDRRNLTDANYNRLKVQDKPLLSAKVVPVDANFIGAGMNVFFDITIPAKEPLKQY